MKTSKENVPDREGPERGMSLERNMRRVEKLGSNFSHTVQRGNRCECVSGGRSGTNGSDRWANCSRNL